MEQSQTDDRLAVGRRFIAAIERRDWETLASLFDPSVQFRALIPSGLREADNREAAANYLQKWFGDADQTAVQSSGVEVMHDRVHIAYRIREHEDQWYLVEQQAYCIIHDGLIQRMDLLCSGFRPEAPQEPR